MKCRVLLTSAGGLVVPSIVKSLQSDSGDRVDVVGLDANKDAVGLHFLDSRFVVADSGGPDFAAGVLRIAKAEAINVVIPGSDREAFALAQKREAFADAGIVLAVSDHAAVATACDKAAMLRFLVDQGLPSAKFATPTNLEELKSAAASLGYPHKKIVFKPRKSSGARGYWIIDSRLRKDQDFLFSPDRQNITLEWLCEALEDAEPFPEILLMEYLSGADFNVDILARGGDSVYVIPNQRIVPGAGPLRVGHVRVDERVQELCRRVVEAFGFDYWINIEVAYGDAGIPLPYEINPRISAPIAFNTAAGVNLLKLGIQMAMGEAIDETLAIRETRVMRYWNELAIHAPKSTEG